MPALEQSPIPLGSQGHNAFLVTFAILGSLIAYVVYQRFLHPLSSIPGPFSASLSRLWITKHSWNGDMHRTMIALHAKHGLLVRTGPNEVSVSDLNSIKTIYGAGTKFRKSEWYSVWQGHRKFDLFAEKDEKIHGKQRSYISSAYSMTSLKDLEPYVDNCVSKFLEKMGTMQNQAVDMGKWVQLFAFDVIGEVSFSKSFCFMESAQDDGSFSQIEDSLQSAAWIGQLPWLYWLNDYLTPYVGNKLSLNNRHGAIRALAVKEVNARRGRGSERKDILSKLFAAQEKNPALDDAAVASMATSNIFAGSDTTAISTRSIIYYLLKNPQCKQRLIDELEQARKNGAISEPIRLDEAEKLPYLQAVMYEALRCHPAVGMSLPRTVPQGGVIIDGKHIPAKTTIGANPWVVHRNTAVFGEDVEAFRPERWLDEAAAADMRRFFFAFGSGSRMCLGRNISWMEMSKLIPALFTHYNLDFVDPEKEWTETCYWFVMQRGLNVRVTKKTV